MLCIEMAIFAVMHIFAFPVTPYKLKQDPLNSSGSEKYLGGPLGIKALIDAFNLWDVVKASARGFRWLFVGSRKRHEDESYQNAKLDPNTGYSGPGLYDRSEVGTELRQSVDTSARGRTPRADDQVGLLGYSAPVAGHGLSPSPSPRPYGNNEYAAGDDSRIDLGSTNQHRRQFSAEDAGMKPSEFDDREEPVSLHPGYGPQATHPALRDQQDAQRWDHWGGAGPGQAL